MAGAGILTVPSIPAQGGGGDAPAPLIADGSRSGLRSLRLPITPCSPASRQRCHGVCHSSVTVCVTALTPACLPRRAGALTSGNWVPPPAASPAKAVGRQGVTLQQELAHGDFSGAVGPARCCLMLALGMLCNHRHTELGQHQPQEPWDVPVFAFRSAKLQVLLLMPPSSFREG